MQEFDNVSTDRLFLHRVGPHGGAFARAWLLTGVNDKIREALVEVEPLAVEACRPVFFDVGDTIDEGLRHAISRKTRMVNLQSKSARGRNQRRLVGGPIDAMES